MSFWRVIRLWKGTPVVSVCLDGVSHAEHPPAPARTCAQVGGWGPTLPFPGGREKPLLLVVHSNPTDSLVHAASSLQHVSRDQCVSC